MADEAYHETIQIWRQEYDQRLTRPDGWLSITGLFWLEQGENSFGANPAHPVPLPPGSASDYAGVFTLTDNQVSLKAAAGVEIRIDDQLITELKLEIEEDGSAEWITVGRVKLAVIQRGDRFGVRIYDPENSALKDFPGTRWHPIQEAFRIQSRYLPLEEPKTLSIENILGDPLELTCDGLVEFDWDSQRRSLLPATLDDGRLWFMFKDATSGETTYPSGRYLIAEAPQDGRVILDFNKAYNLPCAYTNHATCPLPPIENHLPFPVQAGELRFHSAAG